MTALAADKLVDRKEGELVAHEVAVDVIYLGAIVKINAAGYLAPMAAEAGGAFAGMAAENVDNSAGSAGDLEGRVHKKGIFQMVSSGLSQSDVGSAVYASDDQTVSTTQGSNEMLVGYIQKVVSATEALVRIDRAVI